MLWLDSNNTHSSTDPDRGVAMTNTSNEFLSEALLLAALVGLAVVTILAAPLGLAIHAYRSLKKKREPQGSFVNLPR